MTTEDPRRREVNGTDQSRLVRVIADPHDLDVDLLGGEDRGGARDRELADATEAEAAADRDALGVLPALELRESPDHERELLREILDRALHHGSRFGVALVQDRLEILLAELGDLPVAEGIGARLAKRLAPLRKALAKARRFARSPMKPSSSLTSRL